MRFIESNFFACFWVAMVAAGVPLAFAVSKSQHDSMGSVPPFRNCARLHDRWLMKTSMPV